MPEMSKEQLQAFIERVRQPESPALMADFTKVLKILAEVPALVAEDKVCNAAARIGDAMAAAQLALDVDHIRGEDFEPSAKVALVQRGETHIQRLVADWLLEVAVARQHYQANKASNFYQLAPFI